jgi:gamma-glutamylcyclotransferase (GGCT)/AIG2-like uncharacterized protein YtfP
VKSGAVDRALYFAYGSNLLSSRLRERVASARALCAARIDGHRLSFGKLGRDGSGKATLVPEAHAYVWGAVYRIDPSHWCLLDRFEPGYERVGVEVTTAAHQCLSVATYVAPETAPEPVALASYKSLVIAGAREHALPDDHIDFLIGLPARGDPDPLR